MLIYISFHLQNIEIISLITGLSIFGWENKWEKMERKKKRLEEENKEIESEVARLKKYIAEQQKDLISQKHTNFELLNQLTECVDVNNRKIMVLEEIWKKVEGYTNILEDHFVELKNQEWPARVSRGSVGLEDDSQEDIPRKILEGWEWLCVVNCNYIKRIKAYMPGNYKRILFLWLFDSFISVTNLVSI